MWDYGNIFSCSINQESVFCNFLQTSSDLSKKGFVDKLGSENDLAVHFEIDKKSNQLNADSRLIKRFFMRQNENKHGYYLEKDGDGEVIMFGRYHQGIKTGHHWRMCQGGGYLVGEVDSLDNTDGDDVVYIYPDLSTCIIGRFSNGCMKQGANGHISGVRREYGILIPDVSILPESPLLKHDPSTSRTISRSPLTRDLYESRHVFVRQSGVSGAGEGLWAKCHIPAGQVCALFNGVRLHRFGNIMSVVAKRDICAGEEIFVNYNYKIAHASEWYQHQWFHHLRCHEAWSEEQIKNWVSNIARMTGIFVDIPPPSPTCTT